MPASTLLQTTAASPHWAHLLLAHGAGAPMTSPFLEAMAAALAGHGITVHRFEFDYMAERRRDGKRRPAPRAGLLADEFAARAHDLSGRTGGPVIIGGKSMGGRIASMIADGLHDAGIVSACVCLGYPFHPAGKPHQLRVAHLASPRCPVLIVQGDRDALGSRREVQTYPLGSRVELHWLADGDHDFRPRRASGHTAEGHIAAAAAAVAAFVDRR